MRRRPALVAAFVALVAATALAPGASGVVTRAKTVNLDADPDLEQVIPQEVCVPFAGGAAIADCAPDQYTQRRIVIEDTCKGAPQATVVSSQQDAVVKLEISNFEDLTPRPEILFDLRSGAGARFGEIRVLGWEDPPAPGGCSQARTLFRYPAKRTRGRRPHGAVAVSTFAVSLRNLTRRYAGKELRLYEYYVDRNDPLCCASFKRVTDFGYSAGRDLYVRYRTHVKRIRR